MRQLFPEVDLANFGHGERKTLPYETTVPRGDVRYLARLEQMISDLKTDSRLEGVEFQFNRINPGVHPADVHRAFVALGFALPTEVLTWYQEVNGLSLRWQEREKNGMAADFALLTLEDIFAGFDPSGLEWVRRREWDFSAADHYVQLGAQAKALRGLKDYRVLYREERSDVLIRFGGDKCALLLVVDDDTYPLRLSFCEFVEQLLRFRGVKYWAYFFAQADPYAELGVPKGYLEKVKKLFPD
jgi:hypothetical protein